MAVMATLNDLYSRLDDILIDEMPGLYKVETIGERFKMIPLNEWLEPNRGSSCCGTFLPSFRVCNQGILEARAIDASV